MEYKGKICPYCKTEFNENDEIVICNVCEMPHHKECWIENKACTTFGCTGTMVGTGESSGIVATGLTCDRCGAPYSNDHRFCQSCGNDLSNGNSPHFSVAGDNTPPMAQYPPTQQNYNNPNVVQGNNQGGYPNNNPIGYQGSAQNNYYGGYQGNFNQSQFANNINAIPYRNDPDYIAFIQTNQAYYSDRFGKMVMSNSKISWNWCSFLFGAAWFAYRRLYVYSIILAIVSSILLLIPGIGWILILAMFICMGAIGNHIYKDYVEKEVAIAKNMDQLNKSIYITKKGGVSAISVVVIYVVTFLLNYIMRVI